MSAKIKNIIIFDNQARIALLPLTYTRPIGELRLGVITIRQKWEKYLGGDASYITEDYLSDKYEIVIADVNYIINGSVLPSLELSKLVSDLRMNQALLNEGELIAAKLDRAQFNYLMEHDEADEFLGFDIQGLDFIQIKSLTDLYANNASAIIDDVNFLTKGRKSQPISTSNTIIGSPNDIFIEEGASVEGCFLNTTDGLIYIAKDAVVMEGSMLRGPLAICDNATIKMGAKIYGGTTIGPHCKVGGEVNNVIFQAYSNKGHDGFLGNSYISEWCNIGADTNSSNLKNNYDEIKLWNYEAKRFIPSGKQFCGLFMGDHSKCGINTMFNTGTVVGVSANIYGGGFPRNFIPSYAWGGSGGFSTYRTDKAFDTMDRVMARRQKTLTPIDRLILLKVFEDSSTYRTWESN